jgi:hypothetical protein
MSIKNRVSKLESVLCHDSTGIGEWTGIILREPGETLVAYENRCKKAMREAISNCRTFFDLVKEKQVIKK